MSPWYGIEVEVNATDNFPKDSCVQDTIPFQINSTCFSVSAISFFPAPAMNRASRALSKQQYDPSLSPTKRFTRRGSLTGSSGW